MSDLGSESYLFGEGSTMEEIQETKRKRIARACQMCQKKKIRCDGITPACTYCVTHSAECIFTQPPKTRGTRKNAKYIENLEQRLRRMENLLTRSCVNTNEKAREEANVKSTNPMLDPRLQGTSDDTVVVQDPRSTPPISNHAEAFDDTRMDLAIESPSNNSEVTGMMDHEPERGTETSSPNHNTSSREHLDYFRIPSSKPSSDTRTSMSAAGFSIFSPKGIQWVIEKTGNTTFKDTMHKASLDENKTDFWESDTFQGVFTRPIFRQLPPKEETIVVIQLFFRQFNTPCPLFQEPLFMDMIEKQYSTNPPNNAGWWASLNAVLAIVYCLQSVHSEDPPLDAYRMAWDFFKNAMAVLTELVLRSSDLWGVQALVTMALFMQGTADPRPTAFLIASAMRLSHTLGLHQSDPGNRFDPVEAEQRKRVFWMAYRVDKDMCIRSRLPLIQDDDDMNVELPSEDPIDGLGTMVLSDGITRFNIFRAMAEFSIIEATVHRNLYSTKAMTQSDEELLITIGDLDRQLEEWKESLPVEFQPEYEIKVDETPLKLHIIVAQFAYYNCLNMIHRTSVTHSYWTNRSSNSILETFQPLNPRVFSSAALCSSAARASIRLTRSIPIRDSSFIWRVLYFPVSALITIFANIIETPTDPRTRSDLRLMSSFNEFLTKLMDEPSGEVKRIWRVCVEFEKIAKDVIEKTEKDSRFRKGVKHHSYNSKSGRRISTCQHDQPLTPESGVMLDSSMLFGSTAQYNNTGPQMISPALTGLDSSQFGQEFAALMGQPTGGYSETQPMFPNGLTMPWNGNTFHGSFTGDVFPTRTPFDFSTM